MRSRFQILQHVGGSLSGRWRIIETTMTIDGPRSRVCDGTYCTHDDAKKAIEAYEGKGEAE